MSCLAAGCEYDTYVVPLRDWLGHNGPMRVSPTFAVQNLDVTKTGSYVDYEEYVGSVVKQRTLDAEIVNKRDIKDDITTDVFLSYGISCHIRSMEHCTIKVYENGYITTFAYAETNIISFLGQPKDQKVVYRIEEEKAKEIIELATDRYLEIKEQIAKDRAVLEERAKIENALETFEQSEETLKAWYNYSGSGRMYYSTFPDPNRELLPLFKALEYEEMEDDFVWGKAHLEQVTYRIDDDFAISLYNHVESYLDTNYDLVGVRVLDNGKYPQEVYLYRYYKIDPTKGKEIVQKAKDMFLEYNKETI